MALPEPPETPIIRNEPMYATVDSDPEEPIQVEEYKEPVPEPVPELETVQEYVSEPESEPEEVEEETDDDDGANEVLEDFIAPKYVSQNSNAPVTPSASLPIRMQKVLFQLAFPSINSDVHFPSRVRNQLLKIITPRRTSNENRA